MRDKKLDRLFLRFRDRGDVRALSRVFDITSRELLEVAAHVTRDASQAEDLLQTTFLIAIERAQRYDGSRRLMPWLVGILTREAMRWNRDASRRIELDRLGSREPMQPSIEIESRELSTALLEAIDKLPGLYRDVLVRHLREEKSAGEIARELDRSPGTVRVQIHRALELLRSSLPAGIALGGIGVVAPRGLDIVRGAVTRAAMRAAREWATSQVAVTAATSVVGGIMLKKLALIAAVVLVFAGFELRATTLQTLQAWRDPLADCLLHEGPRLGLKDGLADFWLARPAVISSGWRLQIEQIGGGRYGKWGNNPYWASHSRLNPGAAPVFNYIIPGRINSDEDIKEHFGAPSRIEQCAGHPIWIYERPLDPLKDAWG